jgi:hypothetical protein
MDVLDASQYSCTVGNPCRHFRLVRHGRGVAYFNRQSAIVNQQWMGAARYSGLSADAQRG